MTNFRTFSLDSARIIAGFALVVGASAVSANGQRTYPRSCDTYICAYHHQQYAPQYATQSQSRRHLPPSIVLPTMPQSVYPSYPSYSQPYSKPKSAPNYYAPQLKPFELKIETDMLVSFEPDPIPTPAIVPQPKPLEITEGVADEVSVESSDESVSDSPSGESKSTAEATPKPKPKKPQLFQKSSPMPKSFGIGVGGCNQNGYPCKTRNESNTLKSKPQPKSWIDEMQLNDVPSRF